MRRVRQRQIGAVALAAWVSMSDKLQERIPVKAIARHLRKVASGRARHSPSRCWACGPAQGKGDLS